MEEIKEGLEAIIEHLKEGEDWELSFKVALLLYSTADKLTQLSQRQKQETSES